MQKLHTVMGFDYVLLLNNDTTVEPDFLHILINAATDKSNVGIVGGKIVFYGKPRLICSVICKQR